MSKPKLNTETGKWELDFRLGGRFGKRIQRKGRNGFDTKDKAEYEQKKMEVDFAEGKILQKGQAYTVDALCSFYEKEHLTRTTISPVSAFHNLREVGRYFGSQIAKDLTPAFVIRWQNVMRSKKNNRGEFISPTTINKYLGGLQAVLNHAVLMGYLDQNPIKNRVKNLAQPKAFKRFLTMHELKALVDCASRRLKEYIFMSFKTGIRPKHLKALQMEDCDTIRGVVIVRKAKRVDNTYELRMDEELREFFLMKKRQGKVTGPLLDWTNHKREVQEAINKSGINNGKPFAERFTIYGIKHTIATLGLSRGLTTWQVANFFGHKDDKTVKQHYAGSYDTDMLKTVSTFRWNELVEERPAIPVLPYSPN
jgi:integrase